MGGKERPILMTTESVKAILDGRKTMTRRVIKPQPIYDRYSYFTILRKGRETGDTQNFNNGCYPHFCPYGQVGDRLWVRETFVLESDAEYGYSEDELKRIGVDRPIKTEDGGLDWGVYHLIPHYRATEPEPNIVAPDQDTYDDKTRWAPSIFMPRWASRITLEITGVRVERLQEITDTDVDEEGVVYNPQATNAPQAFKELWDSINGKKYPWLSNPWVWVIKFDNIGVRVK